ncbi:DUF1566 domain-containing protein [Halochromatium glycolicum]|uniref:PEP-CTERM protein-sorting domain-containing protein n=1 Tax=Halochromatium glycolicum TaxID=85075 RepID=A0AAJ0U204_9GAMM|nr:DUF1566 domain-containing protein [Halochromatium glycolicum]MBK1703618.1 hypothetical protein [Halochromatium glycolicum]
MAMKTWQGLAAASLLLAGGGAQAALVPYTVNGVDLVYDDDYTPFGASSPGLTWTANANLAATVTFGVSGINASGTMTWDVAQAWIDAMNAANYAGANDWRLWSALNSDGTGPCGGFNCTDSELGHLFYEEGGLAPYLSFNSSSKLTDVFTNMQDFAYWSDTEDSSYAWFFLNNGEQGGGLKVTTQYGWAVRPGQIAAAPVPVPGTALLTALGFAAMALLRRARRRL